MTRSRSLLFIGNPIERMRKTLCPCRQKDHSSGALYEAVNLTPRQTVCKSTLAENTLSLLVSVSPGLHLYLWGLLQNEQCVWISQHNLVIQYTAVTVCTWRIWQSAIVRIFGMCFFNKSPVLKTSGCPCSSVFFFSLSFFSLPTLYCCLF